MAKYCFGIDVGGTTVKCGLFETEGVLVDKWEIVTRSENGGEAILPDIAASITEKLTEKGIAKEEVAGIGIGVPGPVKSGKVLGAVNLHWGEKNVNEELGALTGLAVSTGNDANVAALGEMWQGGAKGYRNVIVVTLGTGVGGGIIVDGRIVEGSHGAGGEIGHAHVTDELEVPCNCGNCGCLEQVASATGIVTLARQELNRMTENDQTVLDEASVTAKDVFDAYKNDDEVAVKIVNRFASYLGTALGSFAAVVDPEVIAVGGGVSKAGEVLTDIVARYYKKNAFPACKNTPIVLAKLGNDAGIYGAAKLAIDSMN